MLNRSVVLGILLTALCILPLQAEEIHTCGKAAALAEGGGTTRQYAPDRKVDILHIDIDVTPDFAARTVTGKVAIQFSPIAEALETFSLDAVEMNVAALSCDATDTTFHVDDDSIDIVFADPIAPETTAILTVEYSCEPESGLYFRTPELGYAEEDMHIWTQGETHGSRHWFPNYDYPNERFTARVTCTVPNDMIVLSNGKLEKDEVVNGSRVTTWHQDKPHVNYLVTLVAGRLKGINDTYGDLPIGFYTVASEIEYAANSFREKKAILEFMEKETGVKFPWAKYYSVAVTDYPLGGMENTSLTVLTNRTLFPDEIENLRSTQGLAAHEAAHQWFGDLLTCKDWGELWLNEGFATYYTHLFAGHKDGINTMKYGLFTDQQRIVNHSSGPRPIVTKKYDSPWEQFGHRAYQKGSWVLHMIRSELGEDLYRKCIHEYLKRNEFREVVTADLSSVIEEISGRSWDRFFDQWIFHAKHPVLDIKYDWIGNQKLAKVAIRQTQETSDQVLTFAFNTLLRFHCGDKVIDYPITIDQKAHEFYVELPSAPTVVRFDPDLTVLAKVNFRKSGGMLIAQAKNNDDMVGQLIAIDELKKRANRNVLNALIEVYNNATFYGVKTEVAKALGDIHTPAAFKALAALPPGDDARVRRQIVRSVSKYYREAARDYLLHVAKTDTNPTIVADALKALGKFNDEATRETILTHLNGSSFRHTVSDAAVRTIRTLDSTDYIKPLFEHVRQRIAAPRDGRVGDALDTLAFLAREKSDKDAILELLLAHVNHPNERFQADIMKALGTLGDLRAMPVLETFANDDDDARREQRAAHRALETLREKKGMPSEVKTLRDEVLKLKKQNERLQQKVDDLNERVGAKLSEEKE
jgi:aminopeptidase N